MASPWALVQVNCTPHSVDRYPMPKTFCVLQWFNNEKEARDYWPEDLVHNPDETQEGQSVYQILWQLGTPLNLDRSIDNCNKISGVGAWLPESVKHAIASVGDISITLRGSSSGAAGGGAVAGIATTGRGGGATHADMRAAASAAAAKRVQRDGPQPMLARSKGRRGAYTVAAKSASTVTRAEQKPRKPTVTAAQAREAMVQEAIASVTAAAEAQGAKVVPVILPVDGYRPPHVSRQQ
jgi:hypothetical protein